MNLRGSFILKHPQVKVYLVGTNFGLELQVLSLPTFLVFFLIRLTKGNDQIKALKSSSVEVKVQTLSLHFLVVCLFSFVFYCFNILFVSLGYLVFILEA